MKRTRRPNQILERILVKHGQKRVRRLLQCAPKDARGLDAAIARLLETSHDAKFLFDVSDDGADVDLTWLA